MTTTTPTAAPSGSVLPTPDELGVVLTDESTAGDGSTSPGVPLASLVRLALRRNPRRAHLLVSTVLAKHVPTVPAVALLAGEALGARVADVLDGGARLDAVAATRLRAVLDLQAVIDQATDAPTDAATDTGNASDALHRAATTLRTDLAAVRPTLPDVLVLGFAETATALGATVAEALGAGYLHSTRHDPPGATSAAGFDEAHSHATAHRLLPAEDDWLPADGTVVLVDDELSTGATARATIRALHAVAPQRQWVVAALVDLRSDEDVAATEALATELGAPVAVVALGRGRVSLPVGLTDTASELVAAVAAPLTTAPADLAPDREPTSDGRPVPAPPRVSRPEAVTVVTAPPTAVDRTGTPAARVRSPRTDVEGIAADLARVLTSEVGVVPDRVLVLGTEEHMATPLAIADALRRRSTADVRSSTSTRSPVAVFDDPAWPIRSGIRHRSHDVTVDGPGERYAYNVHGFDAIVVVPEPGTEQATLEGPDGLLDVLAAVTPRVVLVDSALEPAGAPESAPRPRPLTGPSFGSYEPDEVTWLLQDLADAALEADTADRERAIQLEGANYA